MKMKRKKKMKMKKKKKMKKKRKKMIRQYQGLNLKIVLKLMAVVSMRKFFL
jgi:hypothetical protein